MAKWMSVGFTNKVVVGSNPLVVIYTSYMPPVLSKEFLDIQAAIECRFTLKRFGDMITTYSQGILISGIQKLINQCNSRPVHRNVFQISNNLEKNVGNLQRAELAQSYQLRKHCGNS